MLCYINAGQQSPFSVCRFPIVYDMHLKIGKVILASLAFPVVYPYLHIIGR